MSADAAHHKLLLQTCHINRTLKIVVESISGDLSELHKLAQPQGSTISSLSAFGENSLCVSAEIWVHGDGAILAPPIVLPFIDIPFELDSTHDSSTERKWSEFPLNLQLRIADLPADSKLVISLFAMTGAFATKAIGCTVMPLFRPSKKHGEGQLYMRTGRTHAFLWAGAEPDLSGQTPSHVAGRKAASLPESIEEKLNSHTVRPSPLLDVHCRALVGDLKKLRQQTQAHLTLCIGDSEATDEDSMVAKKYIVFCAWPRDGDSTPAATENFFAFPFIEDFIDQQTPAEHKHRAMSSSVVSADRTLKPDSQELVSICAALNSPPNVEPTANQRQLLWTYRFSLLSMERAVKRLLLWFDESSAADPESQLVKDLIVEWERQVVLTPYDGLPFLSQSFRNPVLRKFGVQILKKNEQGHDESMQQMLLQLVQALRYEQQINASFLAELLVKRSQRHEAFAYAFHWFLTAEKLADPHNMKFEMMIRRLSLALTPQQKESVVLQTQMVDALVDIASQVKTLPAKQRVSALRDMLQNSSKFPFPKFANMVPLPFDPQLKAKCVDIERSEVFTSSQVPVGLTFILEDGSRYSAILKTGDDVRQDQLILQTICIMDGILKRYGVDMRLTPYRALAVSKTAGFVQKVPDCERMSVILNKYSKSIIKFLKELPPPSRDVGNPGEKEKGARREMANKHGINPEVYYNFVYSCAGYCVITYILGIGDRHLDNILIQRNGKLFHIDFGFILGADPKPMPVPMRIVKEMVEAMGGMHGEAWATCQDLCVEMFNRLRKHADFFVSLFALMKHGGITGISGADGNEAFAEAKITFLWSRFHVELDDERAGQKIRAIIQESAKALFPAVLEMAHSLAQWWKQ